METQVINATEYRNVSLALLNESKTNPRRTFEETALKELAASIRTQGVLSPLLVRPLTENGFEIIAGARRYRAAQMAEVPTVPVRIVNLTDAQAIEMSIVENLQRKDVHPLEEAQGFRALLDLEEPKYSIEQIAAKVGKSPVFVASRLKLIDLVPAAVDAFYADEIGVGHALLLAKLPSDQQGQALSACFKEVYNNGANPARILLPVRNLQFWIDSNILLVPRMRRSTSGTRSLSPPLVVVPTAPSGQGTTSCCLVTTSAGRATAVPTPVAIRPKSQRMSP